MITGERLMRRHQRLEQLSLLIPGAKHGGVHAAYAVVLLLAGTGIFTSPPVVQKSSRLRAMPALGITADDGCNSLWRRRGVSVSCTA
jgi:hypothetical protein